MKSPLVVAIVGNFSGWSPSPPENNVVRQENPKIVISPVIAEAVNTVSFLENFFFYLEKKVGQNYYHYHAQTLFSGGEGDP